MGCSRPGLAAAALLAACAAARPAHAQLKVALAGVRYESPTLVAPLAVLILPAASGSWTLSVLGSTGEIERVGVLSPARSLVAAVAITAFGANASRYVYRAGRRDTSLAFENRTVQLSAGLRFDPTPRLRGAIGVVGLFESLTEQPDSVVRDAWRRPFAGLRVEARYAAVTAEDVFSSRWDGLAIAAGAAAYFGSRSWWKARVSAGGGRTSGRLSFGARATLLTGENLDVVSRHLVGGSWDAPDAASLYGHHYAEYRVERGGVASAAADLRVLRNWEIGLRLGALASPDDRTWGQALRLATLLGGVTLSVGAGFPGRALLRGEWRKAVIFGGASAGLVW